MNTVATDSGEQGWRARLQLEYSERERRTYLSSRSHIGPLVVQRAFHPEGDTCHTYIVHPPGGIVGGDELRLEAKANVGTQVLLTTPAATKFYRSAGPWAHLTQIAEVEHAQLEWLPQETIFYPGSRVQSATRVMLRGDSPHFVGWEIPCLGLPAREQAFDCGELRLDFGLWKGELPLFIDRMRLSGDSLARKAQWGLAGFEALGTLLAYPATKAHVESCRGISCDLETAVTLVDNVLVCRALASQAEPIKQWFVALWCELRPQLLGRAAHRPRIWAT